MNRMLLIICAALIGGTAALGMMLYGERRDAERSVRVYQTLITSLEAEVQELRAGRRLNACGAPEGAAPIIGFTYVDSLIGVAREVTIFANNVSRPGAPFGLRVCENGYPPVEVGAQTADQAWAMILQKEPATAARRRR